MPSDSAKPNPKPDSLRLQKYLAECGFGSRRACEEIITSGRVTVDGEVISVLGSKVDPSLQQVTVDGQPAQTEKRFTLLVNKPTHVICSSNDPEGRRTVLDLIGDVTSRLYTVGRLDFMSQGLILVTNEGELAHRLTHPRYHIEKEYRVLLADPLQKTDVDRLCKGIMDDEELLKAKRISRGRHDLESFWILSEGKNRQIRRMAARLGLHITKLERIRFGPLHLGKLPQGESRELTESELTSLRSSVGL